MLPEIDGFAGYLTLRTAAKLSGISPVVLYKRIERGRIPAMRIERTLLVRPSDVLAAKDDDRRFRRVRDALSDARG